MTSPRLRTAAAVLVAPLAAGAMAMSMAPASVAAAPPPSLNVTYDAVGSSTVAKTGSSVALGPTTLNTRVRPDGSFVGELPLPPATTSFRLGGLLPVAATVNFVPTKQNVLGTLRPGRVDSRARYYLKLTNVTVAGLPTFVGDSCQTSAPVTIPANTPKGQKFDLTNGGTLAGTYTIGSFANCGLTTALVNQLVPGPGNTMSIAVSNGRIG